MARRSSLVALALAASSLVLQGARALPDGMALTPPSGWRSWNALGFNVSQQILEDVADALASKTHALPNGTLVSLAGLGYSDCGLDDGWQACGAGPDGTYFNASGWPIVDTKLFPDMRGMVDYIHSLGLTAGFYGNNCHCASSSKSIERFINSVNQFVEFDFDGYKLDSCGGLQDIQLWANLLNQTSPRRIIIENCHNGPWLPEPPRKPNSPPWAPFHFYRSSLDIEATYGPIMGHNLQTVIPLANQGLSFPGNWAYPDMLEVGVTPGLHKGETGLTYTEARSHFGAWCIVSSPLVLGLDPRNQTALSSVWDIVSNTEAIAVNRAWAPSTVGYVGTPNGVAYSGTRIAMNTAENKTFTPCGWFPNCTVPTWEVYSKPLPGGGAAVLFLNHGDDVLSGTITIQWSDVPALACKGGSSCAVRDVWQHKDLGSFSGSYSVSGLASHDSVFLTVG